MLGGVVDAMPRVSVITITGDGAGFGIKTFGPLPAVGCDGYNQIIEVFNRPAVTKAAGIATFQQYGKGVIGDISRISTFINRTSCQVDTFQLCKGYGFHFATRCWKSGYLFNASVSISANDYPEGKPA